LAAFLNIIRERRPTELEIHNALVEPDELMPESCIIDENSVQDYIDASTTIMCSHREDVNRYNTMMVKTIFGDDALRVPVQVTPMPSDSRLASWLGKTDFHTLPYVAVGARVLFTKNINKKSGCSELSNGNIRGSRTQRGGYNFCVACYIGGDLAELSCALQQK
jgi:hypothetical protein